MTKMFSLKALAFAVSVASFSSTATVLFDQSYLQDAQAAGSDQFNQYAQQLRGQNQEFSELMEDKGTFSGLYVRLEGVESLDSDYYDRKLALEMEFFEDGWRESSINMDKKKQQSALEYLQLQNNMLLKRADSETFKINLIGNKVRSQVLAERISFLQSLVSKRQKQLAQGYVAQSEVMDVELKLSKAQIDQDYLSRARSMAIPASWHSLLNRLESIQLLDNARLTEMAIANSHDMKIQDLLVERAEFFPDYLDDVSVRLFVERRDNNRFFDDAENVVGVRVRLPIDFDQNRDDIVSIQQQSYGIQKQAIAARLEQRVDSLTNLYQFKVRSLRVSNQEFLLIDKQREVALKQAGNPLSGLAYTPERRIEELDLQKIQLHETILLARLELLSILTELKAVVNTNEVNELIQPLS